jgi:hypothetical protein
MKIGVSMFCLGAVLWALVFFNNAFPHHAIQPEKVMAAAATPSVPPPAPHSKSKATRPKESVVSWTRVMEQATVVAASRRDLQQAVQESKLASPGPGFDTRWVGTINYQVREFNTGIMDMQNKMHELQRALAAQRKYRETYGGDVSSVAQAQHRWMTLATSNDQDQTYMDWVQRQLANRIIASR